MSDITRQLSDLAKRLDPSIEPMTMFALEMRKAQLRQELLATARANGVDNSETEIVASFETWWRETGFRTWLAMADGNT